VHLPIKLLSAAMQQMHQIKINTLLHTVLNAATAVLQKLVASGRVSFACIKFVFVLGGD